MSISAAGRETVRFDSVDDLEAGLNAAFGHLRERDGGSDFSTSDEGPKSEPEALPWIPKAVDFFDGEFKESPELREIGDRLIRRWPELRFLEAMRIRYLWKEEGGQAKGHSTLGKCTKPSGFAAYFANCDFVIWCAADHCRVLKLTEEQMEACVYHELCHCAVSGKDEVPAVVGHDFEAFCSEVRRYGPWKLDLEMAAKAFGQMPLPETA